MQFVHRHALRERLGELAEKRVERLPGLIGDGEDGVLPSTLEGQELRKPCPTRAAPRGPEVEQV